MGIWHLRGGVKWDGSKCTANECMDYVVNNEPDRDIFLGDKDLITAGFVDFHSHVYAPYGRRTEISTNNTLSTGIVAMNDAGTFGYDCWERANRFWQKSSKIIGMKSFLHLIPDGCELNGSKNRIEPLAVNREKLVDMYQRNKEVLVGFKAHLGWKNAAYDEDLLKLGRRVGDETGAPLMAHIAGSYLPIEKVLEYLKPGDIFCHPFHPWQNNLLDNNGKFSQAAIDAQKRGIHVDFAHGKIHFCWKIFRAAIEAGFMADTISSDMWGEAWNQAPLVNIDRLFSSLVAFGLPLDDILIRMTTKPAEKAGLPIPSFDSSLVVMRYLEKETFYSDINGDGIKADFIYEPGLIAVHGDVMRLDY